jgi:hypothetical protein
MKEDNILKTFEWKILRRIYGSKKENGIWRWIYNYELCKLCDEPDVGKVIKVGWLRRLGHLFRTEQGTLQEVLLLFSFVVWGEAESTWCIGHYLAYYTRPGWWMMTSVEQLAKWLAAETKVLGEYLPPCCFVQHKLHMTRPGLEPGPPQWEGKDEAPEL